MKNLAMTSQELAKRIRRRSVLMASKANASHSGGNLSSADLLAVLYGEILDHDPRRPDWPDRDRFILSKGHSCAAVYAVLVECGYFPESLLETYYQDGSALVGHANHHVPGVELSTGSLGHGLTVGAGMALAGKRDGKTHRIFCLLSDGEMNEGSNWEAVLFAPQHKLDNLVVIVDYNKIQSFGRIEEVMDLAPLAEKFRAFGWAVEEIDGHDLSQIEKSFKTLPFSPGRPSCVVANTVKGKGVSYMEDQLLWHYRAPRGELLDQALAELERQ